MIALLILAAWVAVAVPVSLAIGRASSVGDEYDRVGELERIGRALRP